MINELNIQYHTDNEDFSIFHDIDFNSPKNGAFSPENYF